MLGLGGAFLLLAVLFGFLGFRESENFKAKNGMTPWGMPSFVWAIICVFSVVLGAILLFIARHTTSSQVGQPPGYYGQSASGPGSGYGGYGGPAQYGGPAGYTGYASAPQAAPAAWHPDPSGRHQLRYFDGSRWTEHVSDSGQTSHDAI